jgi:hypothetical protein
MRKRLGLLLALIPAIGSAAYVLSEPTPDARPSPAPKTLEAPQATPAESSDDAAQSHAPQPSPGEVIGVPMLA